MRAVSGVPGAIVTINQVESTPRTLLAAALNTSSFSVLNSSAVSGPTVVTQVAANDTTINGEMPSARRLTTGTGSHMRLLQSSSACVPVTSSNGAPATVVVSNVAVGLSLPYSYYVAQNATGPLEMEAIAQAFITQLTSTINSGSAVSDPSTQAFLAAWQSCTGVNSLVFSALPSLAANSPTSAGAAGSDDESNRALPLILGLFLPVVAIIVIYSLCACCCCPPPVVDDSDSSDDEEGRLRRRMFPWWSSAKKAARQHGRRRKHQHLA